METDAHSTPDKTCARKRTLSQRTLDLEFISCRIARGQTHQEIADALAKERCYSLSRAMISQDVAKLREQWQHEASDSFHMKQILALRRLDEVEREAWDGWAIGKLSRTPNPAFLRTVLDVSERRSRLLGLDAAIRTEVTGANGGPLQVASSVELSDEAMTVILKRHAAREAAQLAKEANVEVTQEKPAPSPES